MAKGDAAITRVPPALFEPLSHLGLLPRTPLASPSCDVLQCHLGSCLCPGVFKPSKWGHRTRPVQGCDESDDAEDDAEWLPGEASDDDEDDGSRGSRKRKRAPAKHGGTSNSVTSEPIYREKVKLAGARFRKELRVDEDAIACRSHAKDILGVAKLSPWPIPLQADVYGAIRGLDYRSIGRLKPHLDDWDQWVVATSETFNMLIRRDVKPLLQAKLPTLHEFVQVSPQQILAFSKRARGTMVVQDILEYLKAIAIEEENEALGDVILFSVGKLRPFDGGQPSSFKLPEGQPGLTGKLLFDFCTGRSHTGMPTPRTSLIWIDLGVRLPFDIDDEDGKVSWPLWEKRSNANLRADPAVFSGRMKIKPCAMQGYDKAGWVTVRWPTAQGQHESLNTWLKHQVLQGLADESAAAAAAAAEAAGEEGVGVDGAAEAAGADGVPPFGADVLEGNSLIWLRPIHAVETGELTILDLYILLLPVTKATMYNSFRHEEAEWINGGSPSFPPASLAPLYTITKILKNLYGPYLRGEDGADPAKSFGQHLLQNDHYSRYEFAFNFRSTIGVKLPPPSETVSMLARALQAVATRAFPLDTVTVSEGQWSDQVSESLKSLCEVLEAVPAVGPLNEHTGKRMRLPISLLDMPEAARIELLGRAAMLRLDVGDTKALDRGGKDSQNCEVQRHLDEWLAQLEAAEKATELLKANGGTAAGLAAEAANRRELINEIVEKRSYICKKGKNTGKRLPKDTSRAKLRAEIKNWNKKFFVSRAVMERYDSDRLKQQGNAIELIRILAAAEVDERIARAKRAASAQRGELRGRGTGENLPCGIRPDLSREERHQELIWCADKDDSHLRSWVEHLHVGRTSEDQEEWDPDASESCAADPEDEPGGAQDEGQDSMLEDLFDDLPMW